MNAYTLSVSKRSFLGGLENLIVSIFVFEYLLRMWSAPNRVNQFFNIYQLIDLVAILPVFLIGQGYQILRVFRALRFLRLVRFIGIKHFFFKKLTFTQLIVLRIVYIIVAIIFVSDTNHRGIRGHSPHTLADKGSHEAYGTACAGI